MGIVLNPINPYNPMPYCVVCVIIEGAWSACGELQKKLANALVIVIKMISV